MMTFQPIAQRLGRMNGIGLLGRSHCTVFLHRPCHVLGASVSEVQTRRGISTLHGSSSSNRGGGMNGQSTALEPQAARWAWTRTFGDQTSPKSHGLGRGVHPSDPHARPRLSMLRLSFWQSRAAWNRAIVNTFRCLVGCTVGDFAMMWFLQSHYPALGVGVVMGASMTAGIASSMALETTMLHLGRDRLPWRAAVKTAWGMSLVSMLAMELVENAVDYHLTGGVVSLDDPAFWIAALLSTSAGFLAPLPYNYVRLRRFGKSCH